jgi:hypothetical protein
VFFTLQLEMQLGWQFRVGGRERFDLQKEHIPLALLGLLDVL